MLEQAEDEEEKEGGREGGARREMPHAAEWRMARDTSCTSTAGHACRGDNIHSACRSDRAGGAGEETRLATATRLSHPVGRGALYEEELGTKEQSKTILKESGHAT